MKKFITIILEIEKNQFLYYSLHKKKSVIINYFLKSNKFD